LHEPLPGLSLLAGRALAEGSRRRDWRQISLEAEDRGMFLQSFGTLEALGVAIDSLAGDWQLTLRWLAELALEPAFPADRLAWLRTQTKGELESLNDQPEYRTARAFLDQLYGPHPYGRPLHGDAASLDLADSEACAAYHQRALGWGGCVVVTGDVDEDAVLRELESLFAGVSAADEPLPALPEPSTDAAERRTLEAGDTEQAHLYAGHLTLDRRHPDLPALDLAAIVLGAGAGMAGRIPHRIREQEGLAYSADVATASGAGSGPGRLVVYVGTGPENIPKAEAALREELERLLEGGIAEEEFAEARSYLLGREPFRRETLRQWADMIAEGELYGLPIADSEWVMERYRRLSRQDVEDVARRHLRPHDLRVTIGLPKLKGSKARRKKAAEG
jgi:zinc protease